MKVASSRVPPGVDAPTDRQVPVHIGLFRSMPTMTYMGGDLVSYLGGGTLHMPCRQYQSWWGWPCLWHVSRHPTGSDPWRCLVFSPGVPCVCGTDPAHTSHPCHCVRMHLFSLQRGVCPWVSIQTLCRLYWIFPVAQVCTLQCLKISYF